MCSRRGERSPSPASKRSEIRRRTSSERSLRQARLATSKIVADRERRSADLCRIITVVTAAVVGGIGLWAVLATPGEASSEWQTLLANVFLSAPFAAIAAYAGRQSGSHRRAERDARHRELQLAALEPFLEPLESEQKAAVRASFAQHLFGPPTTEPPADMSDMISSPDLARALVGAFVQNGKK